MILQAKLSLETLLKANTASKSAWNPPRTANKTTIQSSITQFTHVHRH